jgi:hypothetical protein
MVLLIQERKSQSNAPAYINEVSFQPRIVEIFAKKMAARTTIIIFPKGNSLFDIVLWCPVVYKPDGQARIIHEPAPPEWLTH